MNKQELNKIRDYLNTENYEGLKMYLQEIDYNLSLEELNLNTSKKRLTAIKRYLKKNSKTTYPILSKCDYQMLDNKRMQVFTNRFTVFFFAENEIIQGLEERNNKEKYPPCDSIFKEKRNSKLGCTYDVLVEYIYHTIALAKSNNQQIVAFNFTGDRDVENIKELTYVSIEELENVLTILGLSNRDKITIGQAEAYKPYTPYDIEDYTFGRVKPVVFTKNENAIAMLMPCNMKKQVTDSEKEEELKNMIKTIGVIEKI